MRARVGAMPQPKSSQHEHQPPGRGANRARAVHGTGMSMESLKRQTAYRLRQEDGDDESSENNGPGSVISGSAPEHPTAAISIMQYPAQHHPHHPPGHRPFPREPSIAGGPSHFVGAMMSTPASYPSHPRHGGVGRGLDYAPAPSYGVVPYDIPANYSNESTTRNYTDSQLGVAGGGHPNSSSHPNMTQLVVTPGPPPAPPYQRPSPQQPPHHPQPLPSQQYSTPRMPRHATVLKDRGSAENSVGSSDPSGAGDGGGYGYHGGGHPRGRHAKNSPPSLKGRGGGSHAKNLNKADKSSARTPQPKEMRSPDGRHTPPGRDRHNMEGQVLFATPNQRRDVPSTPSSVYSEPPRSRTGNHRPHHHHQNMSPNYNRMRSPDHHAGNYSKGASGGGGGAGYYSKNHQLNNKHQSKLPHGLTVQELKEMTRARLAAEAEVGGPEGNGSSDQSVHSAGTQGSSKGSGDQFSAQGRGGSNDSSSANAVTRNLVRDNESIRQRDYGNQGRPTPPGFATQGQQMQQQNVPPPPPPYHNYPRHATPPFGAGPPNQYNGGNNGQHPPGPPQRQTSPPPFLTSSMTRSQGEAWETASAASAEYPDSGYRPTGGGMPFSSPISESNMRFNRGRCFSAGATAGVPSSSFEQQHQPLSYYDAVPLSTGAVTGNRQRCATVSPPGMSRLHEDRPFLFSTDDKERLAIPPLSEPRLRLHSTGGLNTQLGGIAAANSAFVPIAGKGSNVNERFLPQSPPPPIVDRSKFIANDRTISTGSAASGHGDLPSSMAEAVLESITSTSGAPIGGKVIGHGSSPFRASVTEREIVGDNSPFRVGMSESSENTSSAFRMDSLLPESSGSMSLFSSGESGGRNLFSSETSERMLLGTHSWGGVGDQDDTPRSNGMGISHDFSNLLNLSNGPALRGRAATEPVWFGGNDPLLVSRIDPELNEVTKSGPPRVSSFVDTNNAAADYNARGQQNLSFEGCFK